MKRSLPRSVLSAIILLVLVIGGAWIYARARSPFAYYGTPYDPVKAAPAISALHMQRGKVVPVNLQQLKGSAVLLYFGYTHCPNICPLTMSYLNRVYRGLPRSDRSRVKVVMVSVDPKRDTPKVIQRYVGFFNPHFLGWHVSTSQLGAIAKGYGVSSQKVNAKSDTVYFINHTSAVYLVDPLGQLTVLYDYTQLANAAKVDRDLKHVLTL